VFAAASRAAAQPATLPVLDVPFISQSELLCGGAAAAMVLRYWGERGIDAESFAPLVDRSAAGIRTTALIDSLTRRGWKATGIAGTDALLSQELASGRPVLALIEDHPGTYHYIVIVAAPARGIVFHDPARAPFRVLSHDEFTRRWQATGRWMAVIVPAGRPAPRVEADTVPTAVTECDSRIADGVARAQRNDLEGAERVLGAALVCPGASPLRELAGVRALQRRWGEAGELARAALAEDPQDQYSWRLLATSEFLQDRPLPALEAWNRVGEPRIDLVRVDGLVRTRQRAVERLVGVARGEVLTRATLVRAERRLAELPSAASTRLRYAPVGEGLAELRAVVADRPVLYRDVWNLAAVGASALAGRSVQLTTGSLTGGGESFDVSWRFWPHRPRVGVGVLAPAPFGGVWGVTGYTEQQPFTDASIPTSRRAGVRLAAANWTTSTMRVAVRGGVDRWRGTIGRTATFGGAWRTRSTGDRADFRVDGDTWLGRADFSAASASVRLRTSPLRHGVVLTTTGGAAVVAAAAPADLWPAGDTGWARPTLLRAHPLIADGRMKAERLGRALLHASGEAQRWWSRGSLLHIAAAAFVDSAQTMRRSGQPSRGDVDVGAGARLSALSFPGVLRIDVAHGLRDGADAISVVYVIE
jgi:hypothetical protein